MVAEANAPTPENLGTHPAADIFPMMAGAELAELVESIRANGLRESIWLTTDGLVLDGRNRLKACRAAGIEPTFNTYRGADPVRFVVDLNLHRRHLNESQRAMVAAKLANLGLGSNQHTAGSANLPTLDEMPPAAPPVSQRAAAEMLNVSERTVRNAAKVQSAGVPELAAAVTEGKVAVSTAAKIAELPAPDQREVIAADDEKAIRQRFQQLADEKREAKRAAIVEKVTSIAATEAKAAQGVYDCIVIDPPWPMQKIERDVRPNQVGFDYPTMTEDELRSLEIPTADDCHVWVWTTHKFLPMAFRLLDAWSLRYVCTFVWHKPGGFQPIGLPQYNAEFALYCRTGAPAFVDTKAFPTCFTAPRGAHSEKPAEFYDVVRRVTVGRRLDMFNRRGIDGFDTWGNEAVS